MYAEFSEQSNNHAPSTDGAQKNSTFTKAMTLTSTSKYFENADYTRRRHSNQ